MTAPALHKIGNGAVHRGDEDAVGDYQRDPLYAALFVKCDFQRLEPMIKESAASERQGEPFTALMQSLRRRGAVKPRSPQGCAERAGLTVPHRRGTTDNAVNGKSLSLTLHCAPLQGTAFASPSLAFC